MNLKKLILVNNDCYKAGRTIKPTGIMVHSTGANNPNLKRYVGPDDGLLGVNTNNNHWNMSGTGACVHAFIGKLKDGMAILIPACVSSSPAFLMMYSAYKLKKQGDNIQP